MTQRLIKFRAIWRKKDDNGKWTAWETSDITGSISDLADDVSDEFEWHVGQFTGLLDKNGKEIWEGDVVHFWIRDDNGSRSVKTTVAYKAPSFHPLMLPTDVEVIGNVYENPELVKKE